MKLFAKYNRINVLSTVIIFLFGCIAFAVLLRYVVINQIDEDLKIEKNEVVSYVNKYKHLPGIIEVRDQYTIYKKIAKQEISNNKVFTHEMYNSIEQEKELQRTIEFNIYVNNDWYSVSVSKSLEGTDDLIQTIIAITVALILLILATTFLINRIVLRRLWQPFYSTLETTNQFNLNSEKDIQFNTTNIDEFNLLNTSLSDAFSKAQQDYQTLKEFTENASHELQTPLAVIQSKLDILIQNEKLSENEGNAIQSAYSSIQSLSRLNQSLLLLAKIENKQFSEQTSINLNELLQDKINQFNEIWKAKKIAVETTLSNKIINGNIHITEILVNNLFNNATKHNSEVGSINIVLNDVLQIANTGIKHSLDESQLFKRFSKQTTAAESQGLGLSIIQQICIASGYACSYHFSAPDLHTFTMKF